VGKHQLAHTVSTEAVLAAHFFHVSANYYYIEMQLTQELMYLKMVREIGPNKIEEQ
jgi:hypothetical protein